MRIALCGEARSGKDTVAREINKLMGWYFNRLAFGDYMKKGYYRDNPHMVGAVKNRDHMIAWSQPIVDAYKYVWVDQLALEISIADQDSCGPYDWIITDLRQPHEEEWCRENGFHIVRVHSPLEQRLHRMQELGEVEGKDLPYWVNADFHIYNDGTLEDLQKSLEKLLPVLEISDKIKLEIEKHKRT